jgi:hypothetical protein
MSTLELAAVLAGAVMALARLFRVAAPLWNYGPAWVQPLLATLPLVLTQLGGALGAVQTKLDLTEVLLVGVLAVAAAVRGATSKAPVAALLLFVGLSTSGCSLLSAPPPDTAARDAYRAAKAACAAYELAPAEAHNDEMDRTCRSLRLVCE